MIQELDDDAKNVFERKELTVLNKITELLLSENAEMKIGVTSN